MQNVLQCDGRVEAYLAGFPSLRVPEPERCPKCGCRKFHRWGSYKRNVVEENKEHRIPVRRMRCAKCKKTFSFLPDFCISRAQYSSKFMLRLLTWVLGVLGEGKRVPPPGAPDARENLRRRAYLYRRRFVRQQSLCREFLQRHGLASHARGFAGIAEEIGLLWREGRLIFEFHAATGQHFMAQSAAE